jgi:hypothetical protein
LDRRWPDVECATSSDFFSLNENIGKVPERPAEQQVVIAAAAPAVVAVAAPEPAKIAEPAVIAVPLPAIIPVIQAQAVAVSESVGAPVVAEAEASAVASAVEIQQEPVAVEITYDSAAAASPEVQAVIIPNLPAEIPAPVVLSIGDEPAQQVLKLLLY